MLRSVGLALVGTVAAAALAASVNTARSEVPHTALGSREVCAVYDGVPEGFPTDPHAGMVLVRGGRFLLGSSKGYREERPAGEVTVPDFYIDRTEVTIYCFAPVGEAPELRAKRIRQYEDFFNASGMATPDDLTEFNESQVGCSQYSVVRWSDMSRGQAHEVAGQDDLAQELGIQPGSSGHKASDEGIFLAQHARWAQLMAPVDQEGGQ